VKRLSFSSLLRLPVAAILLPGIVALSLSCGKQPLAIGSKKFAESNVLGEIALKVLKERGMKVEHKEDLGNTAIVWAALKGGSISLYPEYTGTIGEEILKAKGGMTPEAMRAALAREGVGMTGELGFNDTYALVMRQEEANRLGIHTISDLKSHPELKVAVTHEFLGRKDGWKPLVEHYGLNLQDVRGIDHQLGYKALTAGTIDLTDAYSTDAEIAEYKLVALADDLSFFPKYKAVFLYRLDIPKEAVAALQKLEGTIPEAKMIQMNAEAKRTKNYALAASLYFGEEAHAAAARSASANRRSSLVTDVARFTGVHLRLVVISLLLAILVGVPLGIVASRPGALSQIILGVTGVIQTIPSLALLALLVPISFFGTSPQTAIFALFLYSLLPIVRNTATGLQDIPTPLRESAAALGLEPFAQLRKIYLPMASRTILAGIKTSAIINVGTATLAALIGAGGLGQPIITGLSLNDNTLILEGAVPAAALALLVQFAFDALDSLLIPRGLRLKATRQ
jgi:osmoprotectant transport system permease protein